MAPCFDLCFARCVFCIACCSLSTSQKLPHHAVLQEDFTFLDAYEAQGLLEVSVFLIKVRIACLLTDLFPNMISL
jgi:hypothetical protein